MRAKAEKIWQPYLNPTKVDFTELNPPWRLLPVICDPPFTEVGERHAPKELILLHFLHLQEYVFCTDALKSSTAVACAVHGPNFLSTGTLNRNTSIFAAGEHAILITQNTKKDTATCYFADFLSVVMALRSGKKVKT